MDTHELIDRQNRNSNDSSPSGGGAAPDRHLRLAFAVAGPVGLALLGVVFTPRGAMTTLATMAAALVVGAAAGYVLANRLSMLLAPATCVAGSCSRAGRGEPSPPCRPPKRIPRGFRALVTTG